MSASLFDQLNSAVKGLLYQSESDEPFAVLHWRDAGIVCSPQQVLSRAQCPAGTSIRTKSLDDFFRDLVAEKSWYGDDEQAAARKYQRLKELIVNELTKVQVFLLGEIEVSIWIIGKAGKDDWFAITTKSIEDLKPGHFNRIVPAREKAGKRADEPISGCRPARSER